MDVGGCMGEGVDAERIEDKTLTPTFSSQPQSQPHSPTHTLIWAQKVLDFDW